MTKDSIINFVEIQHPITYSSSTTKVTCKQETYNGFFQKFSDYEELKNQNKWRFVEIKNADSFHSEHNKTGVRNEKHSTLINGDDIVDIQIV